MGPASEFRWRAVALLAAPSADATTASATKPVAPEVDAPKVVLLGDSVFDNFYWLETPKRHLRVQLQELLESRGRPEAAVSLAVDQMTTFDFEERSMSKNPWDVFEKARQEVDFDHEQDRAYPVARDGYLKPVASLKRMENVKWALISIGGNDVLLNIGTQSELAVSLVPGLEGKRQDVADAFGTRLRNVVEAVRKAQPDASLALVIPYRPHLQHSLLFGAPVDVDGAKISGDFVADLARGFEKQYLSELVSPMVREMLAVGREFNCPVVDLSKTFDPTNEQHYGTGEIGRVNQLGVAWSGVEPSDTSSVFIAELLAHVICSGSSERPMVYSGRPQLQGGKWSLLVQERANDPIDAEAYQFGPTKGEAGAPADDEARNLWFSTGVAVALLFNGASILDALVFSREEYEADVDARMANMRQLADAEQRGAQGVGVAGAKPAEMPAGGAQD